MAKFYWDDLLDCLFAGSRSVVPVIGNELLRVPDENGVLVSFSDRLARFCARWLREYHGLDLPDDVPMAAQIRASRREGIDFSPAPHAAHQELLHEIRRAGPSALPESLRLLAEIHSFSFYVSTTADDLLSVALGVVRPEEVIGTQLDKLVDLPLGWEPGQPPRVFQLFGRFGAGAEPAISEEDTLEYLAHLHDKGRPARLLSHLRQSHLLLLGNQHNDWLARIVMRFLRDERFVSGRRPTFEALADTEARGSGGVPLVRFLSAYSPKTRVFDEDDTAGFIRALHNRWLERAGSPQTHGAPAAADDGAGNTPPPMTDASIFISYASEDRTAAEALAAALTARKLPVWLDRRHLQGGDNYVYKIDEYIRRCRLFLPLLSRQSASRHEGWFRREWQKARERLETVGPDRTFAIPVVIDDSDAYTGADLRRYFTISGHETHVLHCPDGAPATEQLDEFVRKFRAAVRA